MGWIPAPADRKEAEPEHQDAERRGQGPRGDRNEDGRIDLYAIGTKGSRIYPTTGTVDHPYGTPETLRRTSDTTFKTVF